MRRLLLAGTIIAAMPMLTAAVAHADLIFPLATGNADISGFPGPYATVDVALTSDTTATITFTALTSPGLIYLMGAEGAVGVNVNATSWTPNTNGAQGGFGPIAAAPGFNTDPSILDTAPGGAESLDGFGTFNQTFASSFGFLGSSLSISFPLTDTSGTWASASNVLAPNDKGNLAGAHIFVTTSPANAANDALATGFAAGDGTLVPVPEPATLALLGAGLLGLGFVRRRRS